MASNPKVIAEFERRKAAEVSKAVRKYGQDALLPAGKPDYDVLDFTINELVGMIRYAEMNENRFQMMLDVMEGLPKSTRAILREGISLARELEAFAARYSYDAISIQQRLRKAGLQLGITEEGA